MIWGWSLWSTPGEDLAAGPLSRGLGQEPPSFKPRLMGPFLRVTFLAQSPVVRDS